MPTLLRRLSAVALGLALALPAQSAIITVDSGTDDGAGCTLREAVEAANTDTAVGGCAAGDDVDDEIRFTVPTVTIMVGQFILSEAVTLTGPVTIEGATDKRLFRVDGDEAFTFTDVTFFQGNANGGGAKAFGGAIYIPQGATVTVMGGAATENNAPLEGGAFWISATASLTVDGTTFTGNSARGTDADAGGGAIYTDGGAVTVRNATFSGNRALGAASGGAILSPKGAAVLVEDSGFDGNRAQRAGGGIGVVGGSLSLARVSLTTNSSRDGDGGALYVDGAAIATVIDSVLSDNLARIGGAVWVGPDAALDASAVTVSQNTALLFLSVSLPTGGALYTAGTTSVAASQFVGNEARGGSGGAVAVVGGEATFDVVEFRDSATYDGSSEGGAFYIADGDVHLIGSTVTGNDSRQRGGGLSVRGGSLTLTTTQVTTNFADEGAGLFSDAEVTLDRSEVSGNDTRNAQGGGLFIAGGTLAMTQSLIADNRSSFGGGGLYMESGTVTAQNSTLHGNRNSGNRGGGVAVRGGSVSFDSCTITANRSGNTGGVYRRGGTVTYTNTVVAGNIADVQEDQNGFFVSGGHNVFGTALRRYMDPTDRNGVDPMLGPLADNGGPTRTALPQPGSPVIDTGDTDLAVDQRGYVRADGLDDVGAVEAGATLPGERLATAPASSDPPTLDDVAVTPNPFTARATATFAVSETQPVTVTLYDVMGRRVREVFAGTPQAGQTVEASIDGGALAAGVYVLVMQGETVRATRPVTVAR